jgi:hypothetical protein
MWHRFQFLAIVAIGATLIVAAGCGDERAAEASHATARTQAEAKETAAFKNTPRLTMFCKGQYVLTVDKKTSTGIQSFGITIDPRQFDAHYFDFEADGSYDSGQRKMNNEVVSLTSVDADWINVGSYRFNRRTLKYDYQYGLASGVCEKNQYTREIPVRKI